MILLTAIAVLIANFNMVQAQEEADDPLRPTVLSTPIYIGPTVGINRSLHTVDLKTFSDDDKCPTFINGANFGFWIGGTFEYLLGNVKNSSSSVIFRAMYSTMPASMEKSGDILPSRVQGTDEPIYTEVVHKNEVTYDMLSFDICYKLNLFGSSFGVTLGPTIDMIMNAKKEQTMSLVDAPPHIRFKEDPANPNISYRDNGQTIVLDGGQGDIPNSSGMRFGVKAGVQYEILLGAWYVVPEIFYNFALTDVTDAEDWRVNAIQIGIDFRYALKF